MSKTRRQLMMLGGLIVVMAVVYVRALRPAQHPSPAPLVATEAVASTSAAAKEGVVSLDLPDAEPAAQAAQRERAASLGWDRDPFTGGAAGGSVSGFDLSGILWDAQSPIAMINGQMVRIGDELEGYKVVEITQNTVLLSDGGQAVNLSIAE